MLHKFAKRLPDTFVYWSNSCGELHHNGEYDIEDVKDLPAELQCAYRTLWSERYGVNCYLVEFETETDAFYGVAFEATYDKCFADDLNISYEQLIRYAKEKALECSEKYPDFNVIFGRDTTLWSDGTAESSVMILVPWDTPDEKGEEIGKYFGSMCYDIQVKGDHRSDKKANARYWDDIDHVIECMIRELATYSDVKFEKADLDDMLSDGIVQEIRDTVVDYLTENGGAFPYVDENM